MKNLPKAYDAKSVEDDIYKEWEESGKFNPDHLDLPANAETFSIPLPPPNATGTLHLGHAMFVIEDIMIRHARMQGKRALWLPGTDHAAIATQNKVEKDIFADTGETRHDIGREELVKRIEKFVEESRSTIQNQLRKMGFSLDWSRERFTLDKGLSSVVRKVFADMYNDGLIYRGNRIVNWCPRCQSTLSDEEVEYREQQAPFYYFKYGPFVIGTVRPETKLGDKVVIVHPDDKRYKEFHGKKLTVPWIDGDIEATVIADPASDPEMGSGAMTITPAHSFVDFELANKYEIDIKNIIGTDGRLTKEAGQYEALTTLEARKKFVEVLKEKGLLDHIDENYMNNLSVCYRCDTAIEPLVSPQWFVAVDKPVVEWKGKKQSLKDIALDVVKSGDIQIIPDRFNKTYFQWMENLHDWCISRQLWYGHRIPVWYKDDETYVGMEAPEGSGWTQDEDVLDTWFSAGMWTFSTLGWPEKTKDMQMFHPSSVLETGYDILFFWVARMILMTTYSVGEIPFEKVYLHGLLRDKEGAKMSKSKDNGIDPLEMGQKYGTDAVRLSLVAGSTPGNDIRVYEEKIAGFRNFVNKLWNISRYILTSVEAPRLVDAVPELTTDADHWIVSHMDTAIQDVNKHMEEHQYGLAIETLQRFTWGEFADWYIEFSKKEQNDELLLYVLQNVLRLWHPFVPFITEHLWSHLDDSMLMVAKWPEPSDTKIDKNAYKQIEVTQAIITEIRNLRGEYSIPYTKTLEVTGDVPHPDLVEQFGKTQFVDTIAGKTLGRSITIGIEGVIDIAKETQRLKKELANVEKYAAGIEKKLGNKRFVENAPAEVVEEEKTKLSESQERRDAIQQSLQQLSS